MRTLPVLVLLTAALSAAPASAGLISNFMIVTGVGLSPVGGTFASTGGNFSGTFAVDESDLPTGSTPVALPYAPGVFTSPGTTGSFTGVTYTVGEIAEVASFNPPSGPPTAEYELSFLNTTATSTAELDLFFLQVAGTFVGGQIIQAQEIITPTPSDLNSLAAPQNVRYDLSGDAIAIDPNGVPEPATWAFALSGILACTLVRYRRRLALSKIRRR